MNKLMDIKEMEKRYSGGEDSLDLTVEKWSRIHDFLETAFRLEHFMEVLNAAVVPIFLCVEYRDRCELCPLFRICERGKSEIFNKVMRVIQSYTIAGDLLPRDPLLGIMGNFVEELKRCKSDARGKAC
ncbi:MAG: hypothetical protein V3V90_08445 [Thermodesulfobacteriota bacterium]|jgi:hypothetical protein